MTENGTDTNVLLDRATRGDSEALGKLFDRHRPRLARMVDIRLDPRLRPRLDTEDVLQEAFLEVNKRLPDFHAQNPMPFFIWLRFLVMQKMAELGRRHLGAGARDARREVRDGDAATWASTFFAEKIAAHATSPSAAAVRAENRANMESALDAMAETDRTILCLRHFERLTSAEAAAELGIAPSAASKRYVRALQRLKEVVAQSETTS